MPERFALGLAGYPLGHSISPALHQAALAAAGLAGDYRLFEAPPLPEGEAALARLMQALRRAELHGLNVTIPHKQNMLHWIDEVSPAARSIGAVNVVYCQDGLLVGDNTDAAGFDADLQRFLRQAGRPLVGQALVLGAGGSARAVVHALLAGGWSIHVAARRAAQAQALADAFAASRVQPLLLEPGALRSVPPPDLIVNSTPLGMHPQAAASPWPEELPLHRGAAVYDLVYNPSQTCLVRAARLAGSPACSGLGMLVEQAALSFERWTGCAADRAAMLSAAHMLLNAKGAI
ncbi:MAG: shikimate dehydrogenase [Anaerolineaceae bacterium]|jgi:shikimate dehydrogenase